MWRSFLGFVVPGENVELKTESESEPEDHKPVVEQLPLTPKQRYAEKKRKMADEEVKALLNRRGHVKGKLTRIKTALAQPVISAAQFEVYKANIEKYYGEYNDLNNKLLDSKLTEEQASENEARYLEYEQLYDEVLVKIRELTTPPERNQAVVRAGQAGQQIIVQQQPLSVPLPTFDGQYENWPKFKAIFTDLMQKSLDSDAIKLYHLEKSLVDAASGSIDAQTIKDNNYQLAWETLEERYENQRLIIDLHISGILQLKQMTKKSSKELRNLIEECARHVENLRFHKQELLGVSELIVIHILSSALDGETRELWEASIQRKQLPKYQDTMDFLKKRCDILERCESAATATSSVELVVPEAPQSSKPTTRIASTAMTSNDVECELCGGSHANFRCGSFRGMSVAERWAKIRDERMCFNCLRKGHRVESCPSERTCKCGQKHNSLLHYERTQQSPRINPGETPAPSVLVEALPQVPTPSGEAGTSGTSPVVSDADDEQQTTSCFSSGTQKSSRRVLLQTAVINVVDASGRFHPCRTLLDSGSQAHILSEAMARKLGLPFEKRNVTVIGANAAKTQVNKGVTLSFASRYVNFCDKISCLVTEKPTGRIPSEKIDISAWRVPRGLQLADPHFNEPQEIDLVMGSDYVWDLLRSEEFKLANGSVTLRETDLGWIVTGSYDSSPQLSCQVVHVLNAASQGTERVPFHGARRLVQQAESVKVRFSAATMTARKEPSGTSTKEDAVEQLGEKTFLHEENPVKKCCFNSKQVLRCKEEKVIEPERSALRDKDEPLGVKPPVIVLAKVSSEKLTSMIDWEDELNNKCKCQRSRKGRVRSRLASQATTINDDGLPRVGGRPVSLPYGVAYAGAVTANRNLPTKERAGARSPVGNPANRRQRPASGGIRFF